MATLPGGFVRPSAHARIAALAPTDAPAAAPLHDPGLFCTVLALAGWLIWTGAAFSLFVTGVDSSGRLTRNARRAALTLVAGVALFALGLAFA